jgi:atrophin-1 interacting protein 3 (BAI1-associated protein 1)
MDQQREMENFVEVIFLSVFFSQTFSKYSSGDILVYVNDTNVLGFSHTDVVRIFQSLSVNDVIRLTVCRGYPLVVNFDDPQIDVVSLNGVNHSSSINNLPNGGYTEYQPDSHQHISPRIYSIKIRKGDSGFGFTVADSPLGQRVKAIVDKQRCQDLCENDLLLSINGQDLTGKQHADVVDVLVKCSRDMETIFIIRRGRNHHLSVFFRP